MYVATPQKKNQLYYVVTVEKPLSFFHLLCGVFPVLERPPPLLKLLYDLFGKSLLLQLPVQVLDV